MKVWILVKSIFNENSFNIAVRFIKEDIIKTVEKEIKKEIYKDDNITFSKDSDKNINNIWYSSDNSFCFHIEEWDVVV